MRPLAFPRRFRGLEIVPLLMVMLAFPASAQTGADPNSAGTAGARVQSESTGGPIGSGPATAKTDTDTATPNTQTDSMAAKPESQPGGSQPQSNPGPKKSWLSHPYRHQHSPTKNDGFCRWGTKIRMAGINRSSRIFYSNRKLYRDLDERDLV